MQQHRIEVTHPGAGTDGGDFVGRMDVCFVAYVRDGMIGRIYEYFDTGRIAEFLPPALTAQEAS